MFMPSRCIARGGNANAQLRGHGADSDLINSIARMHVMQDYTPQSTSAGHWICTACTTTVFEVENHRTHWQIIKLQLLKDPSPIQHVSSTTA